ncbi:MAG: hypothetical protein AAF235_05780 [Planctomycetota bacterium]
MTRNTRVRITTASAGLAALGALGGCSSGSLVGTWQSQRAVENLPSAPFDFAAVTFAPDGTYTAEMVYGGRTLAETGTWTHAADELVVGPQPSRRYGVEFLNDGVVSFVAPEGSVTMLRYRP